MPEDPLHRQLADRLRQRIEGGEKGYRPGDKLATYRDLARVEGVGHTTMKLALRDLVDEGLLTARQGSGFRVAEPMVMRETTRWYKRGSGSPFFADERAAGRTPSILSHHSTTVAADEQVATLISADVGEEITQTDYVFGSNGRPVMLSRSWELLRFTRGRLEDPEGGPSADKGVLDRFDGLDVRASHVVEKLRARTATPDEAKRLQIRTGSPVLENLRTYHAGDLDLRFEAAIVVTSPDYRYVYTLPIA